MTLIRSRSAIPLAIWAAGVAFVAWSGARADGYRLHVLGEPLPHPYPWQGVLTACVVLSLAALALYALIRPETYRRSWGRALASTAVGAIGVVVIGLGLMHSPPHVYALWLWLVAVTTISLGLFLVSAWSRAQYFLERLEIDIPEGAVAEVVVALPTTVLTHWRAPFTGGFKCELPPGSRLTAYEAEPRGSRACTFVPSDLTAFEEEFVPRSVVAHPKYAGVSIVLTAHVIRRHLKLMPTPDPTHRRPTPEAMAEPGFLAKHGILRNAIRADLLQFHLPFFGVFAVALLLCFRGAEPEGLWRTLWCVVRQPGSLLDLSPQKAIGLILFVGGLTVMLVAQITLWRNYSGTLVIKKGHRLIQHGIYRHVRHPIYLGLLVVIVGLPLYASSLPGLLTMVVLVPILLNRIRLEEGLLIEEFGDDYRSYRRRTRKLIPFVY